MRNVRYQLHLVRRRGGETVPRAHALHEIACVFGARLVVTDDEPARPYVVARASSLGDALDDDAIARRALRLGYTRAVVRVAPLHITHDVTLDDETARAPRAWNRVERGLPTGAWRSDGAALELTPLVVVDDDERRVREPRVVADDARAHGAAAPSGRPPVHRRRLSTRDARFVSNVCALADGARVLDPFAGPAVLADALGARALDVVRADIDPRVLVHASGARAVWADARALPFDDAVFDGVVTEPPYRAHERASVVESAGELARVVRAGGALTLLLARSLEEPMVRAITPAFGEVTARFAIARHGLACAVVVIERHRRP